jgi:hypothetical protein
MLLSRWKMMAGVVGVSIGGLAAAASQCPKWDSSKGRSSDEPVAKVETKVAPAGPPALALPPISGPDVPAAPVLIPAGVTFPAPPMPGSEPTLPPIKPTADAPKTPAPPATDVTKPLHVLPQFAPPAPKPAELPPAPVGLPPVPKSSEPKPCELPAFPSIDMTPAKPPVATAPPKPVTTAALPDLIPPSPTPAAKPSPPPVVPTSGTQPPAGMTPTPPDVLGHGPDVVPRGGQPTGPATVVPLPPSETPLPPPAGTSGSSPGMPPARPTDAPPPGAEIPVGKPPAPVQPIPVADTKFRILLRVGDGEPMFEVKNGDSLVLKVVCDKVDIKSPEKGAGLAEVTARGKVRFAGFGAEGTCDELKFFAGNGEVSMTGEVKVVVRDKLGRVESELTSTTLKYKIDASSVGGQIKP